MPRRASSSFHPGAIAAALVVIILAVLAGRMMLGRKATGFADTLPLDIQELLENGNSLRGNEYVVEGEIDEKLRWDPTTGQVVSLRVKTNAGDEFMTVEIPSRFNDMNISVKQKYAFRVEFRQGGIAVATGVNRL
jgi:hypothetical protein